MAVNVMSVSGVPFLVGVLRGLNLVTAEYTPSCMAKQLSLGLTRVMDLYLCIGFHVGMVLMDNEAKKLRNLVPILVVNTMAPAKEHMPEVKRCIRLIKEQGRGILNTLSFKRMPQVILIELIYHVVLWLNTFPTKQECQQCSRRVRWCTGTSWTLPSTAKPSSGPTARPTTSLY